MKTILLLVTAATAAWAQSLDLKSLDRFKARASDTADINLTGPMLQLGARFLSNDDEDQAKIKKLVAGLTSIRVRTFEFEKDGEFQESDLDVVRNQLKTPAWSRIVGVRSTKDGEHTEIYLRVPGKGQTGGLAIVASEKREITVIEILGAITLDDLGDLAGNFGIPPVQIEKQKKKEDE